MRTGTKTVLPGVYYAILFVSLLSLSTPAEDSPAYAAATQDVLTFMRRYTTPDGKVYYLPASGQSRTVSNLKTVTGPGDGNIWKKTTSGSADKVLVATLTKYNSYTVDAFGNNGSRLGYDTWVTLAPELPTLLGSTFRPGNDPGERGVVVRALQALGMPDSSTNDRIAEFFIDPAGGGNSEEQLFRPAMNPDIDAQATDADAWSESGGDWRKDWIIANSVDNFAVLSDAYPWTGLGYTYDWGSNDPNRQGLSEFIAPGASQSVTVSGVSSAGSYIYALRDGSGDYAGEMNGSFDVWGTADTIWGRKSYFRKLYYDASATGNINIRSGGGVTNGILIDGASYNVVNAGSITAPASGRHAYDWRESQSNPQDPDMDAQNTDNVFRIVNAAGGTIDVAITNNGVIGQTDLAVSHTLEIWSDNAAVKANIVNNGQLYSGVKGVALSSGANENLLIENRGILYGAAERIQTTTLPAGGDGLRLENYGTFALRGGMAFNGDVIFHEGSVWRIDPEIGGVLRIGGDFVLQRDVSLEMDAHSLAVGDSAIGFAFLEMNAGGTMVVDGTFAQSDSAVISYDVRIDAAAQTARIDSLVRHSTYADAETAKTRNTSALAAVLDALPGTDAGPDAARLVNSLDGLNAGELGDALRTLQAEPHALTQLGSLNLSRHFLNSLPSPASGRSAPASARCNSVWSVWATPSAAWSRMGGGGRTLGYEHDIRGGSLGFTRTVGAGYLGASFGGYDSRMDFRGITGRDDAASYHAALYGGFAAGRHLFDFQAAYGWIEHDVRRDILFGATPAKGEAEYRDHSLSVAAAYAFRAEAGAWELTPSVGARFFHLRRGSDHETVRGAADLLLASRRRSVAEFPLSFTATTRVATKSGITLSPTFRAAFIPEAGRRNAVARLGVRGAGTWADAKSADLKRWRCEAGAGMDVGFTEAFAMSFRYDFSGNGQTNEHRLTAGLGLSF